MKFKIEFKSYDLFDRPRMSYKIREYFEEFVEKNILIPKNIIVSSKVDTMLVLLLDKEKKSTTSIPPYVFEGIKTYIIYVPYEEVMLSLTPICDFVNLLYETIELFFLENFKKVKKEFLDDLQHLIDYKYLLSLPYPAPFEEQRYVDDTTEAYRSLYLEKFGF